jgi:hypothetical protein
MSTNRFVLAALAGGIALFVSGFLIFGIAAADFYMANQGTAVGAMKETPDMLYLFVGQLGFGVFLTVLLAKWARVSGAANGFKLGALAGLLIGFSIDLTMYGVSNVMNLTASLVDPILVMIQMAIGGAVIGWVLGRR